MPSFSAIPPTEPVRAATTPVACDGDVAHGLGHPRVFLDLPAGGEVVCPYCSRLFLWSAAAPDEAAAS
ncbi:MAG: hypothetical protein RLZZ501_1206 [Pseudomonadota bacterium]|jgi:uncharacterized Zn-finger protein